MYTAIQEIQETFEEKGLKHRIEQVDDSWILRAGVAGKSTRYEFLFVKEREEGNDVAVRVFDYARIPEGKRDQIWETLNEFQIKYRYTRFCMKDDGNVLVEYDFPVEFSPIGEGAAELLIRMTKIMDECYPILMKAIWS